LQNKLPQAICGHKPRVICPDARIRESRWRFEIAVAAPEKKMPDTKIVTEVAGRICALPVAVGASVGDGDDIAFVEAMKMEIPVPCPAAGKLKSILVRLDDVVVEGQAIAILET
jgi:biotin carboxyl carrier protein